MCRRSCPPPLWLVQALPGVFLIVLPPSGRKPEPQRVQHLGGQLIVEILRSRQTLQNSVAYPQHLERYFEDAVQAALFRSEPDSRGLQTQATSITSQQKLIIML